MISHLQSDWPFTKTNKPLFLYVHTIIIIFLLFVNGKNKQNKKKVIIEMKIYITDNYVTFAGMFHHLSIIELPNLGYAVQNFAVLTYMSSTPWLSVLP